MEPSSHVTFVVNPVAGTGRSGRQWANREQQVRERFPQADVQFTHARSDAIRLASSAAERGQELVVAVGGDGTMNEVVNGLMTVPEESRPCLGLLPSGSGGDFARGQGVPSDTAQALALLQEGQARRIDVGRLQCGDQAPRYFLNAADAGVGARVVERMQRGRRWLPPRGSYLWQSICGLLAWRNPEVCFQADDGPEERVKIKALVLANNPYFGSGMCIAPDAKVDSGELAFVVFGDLGRLEAVRRLGETYAGKPIEHKRITYRTCRKLKVTSANPVPVEADGELMGYLPWTAEVLPGALRMMLPPTA